MNGACEVNVSKATWSRELKILGSGMGKGPALALLLAGPALPLSSMLVLRSIMGTKKVVVYVSLVLVMATVSGLIYGALQG